MASSLVVPCETREINTALKSPHTVFYVRFLYTVFLDFSRFREHSHLADSKRKSGWGLGRLHDTALSAFPVWRIPATKHGYRRLNRSLLFPRRKDRCFAAPPFSLIESVIAVYFGLGICGFEPLELKLTSSLTQVMILPHSLVQFGVQ